MPTEKSLGALRAIAVALVLAATLVSYLPTLSGEKEFTNWDDPGYVTDQPLVRSLSRETLRAVFDPQTEVMYNYHPLTVLSLALNYRFSGSSVRAYALTNLFLHLVNTGLVFVLLFRFSGRALVGVLGALWFGIHPMHVESVAWISGRKDLVYGLFFLLACLAYLHYLAGGGLWSLTLAFVAFVASAFSKLMAVPLPFVLLLLDAVHGRRIGPRALLEKVPFFLVALWIGWVGVRLQARQPIADFATFGPLERVVLAAHGFVMYWIKLVAPYRLSAFYPYPDPGPGGSLPFAYWLMPLAALLVLTVPIAIGYRRGRQALRTAGFGIGFFVLTIVIVLQFVSFGKALMADRYTYLAYVGALLLIASAVDALLARPRVRIAVALVVIAWSAVLGIATYRRTWVWTNSELLWSDVIAKYPFRIEEGPDGVKVLERGVFVAYENRGNYYRERGQRERAIRDYELLVKAQVPESGPYINMGNVHGENGDQLLRQGRREEAMAEFAKALEMYSLALAHGAYDFETFLNRGITYASMRLHEPALADFQRALALRPAAPGVLASVAYEELQLGRYEECIADAGRILAVDPNDSQAYLLRGMAHAGRGSVAEAVADLQRAVEIAPGLGAAWSHLSVLYARMGNGRAAEDAAARARATGQRGGTPPP